MIQTYTVTVWNNAEAHVLGDVKAEGEYEAAAIGLAVYYGPLPHADVPTRIDVARGDHPARAVTPADLLRWMRTTGGAFVEREGLEALRDRASIST